MDFIERWFGGSPDGGDGTLELLYMGVSVLIAVALLQRIVHRVRYRGSGQRTRSGSISTQEIIGYGAAEGPHQHKAM